jgi:hypothetical protein
MWKKTQRPKTKKQQRATETAWEDLKSEGETEKEHKEGGRNEREKPTKSETK